MTFNQTLKKRWGVFFFGVFTAAIITALNLGTVVAIESGGIGGKPANPSQENPRTQSIFVYKLEPNQEVKDAVRIYNNTDQQKTIKVYAVDSVVSSGGAFACAQAADQIKDVGSWITLDKTSVNLAPKASESVGFTVKAPANIEPGEHNGCIAIQEEKPSVTNSENGIALSFRSAIRVAITVPGEIKKDLVFRSLKTDVRKDKIIASALLKNNGNVSLDTNLSTKLQNLIGVDSEKVEGTYVVLPRTLTELNFEFKRPYWGGWYKVTASASYNDNASEALGEGVVNKTQTFSSGYFFVFPAISALFIELGVLIAAIVAGRFIWQRYWVLPRMKKDFVEYKVKEGDDIKSIAAKTHLSWKHLARANKLKAPYTLRSGSVLHIPNSTQEQKNKNKPSAKLKNKVKKVTKTKNQKPQKEE